MDSARERKKRPGHLKKYAQHAGIALSSAAEQLKRIGIDYSREFDFADADRKREAARSADRAPFAKPIYSDAADTEEPHANTVDPVYAQEQAKREHYKAELARLEYQQILGELVDAEAVQEQAFAVSRQVRDAMLNIPSRLAGILAAETDQRRCYDLLEREIRQALESLTTQEPIAA